MKQTKSLLLFGTSLLVSACFNPPDFDHSPSITFEDVYIKSTGEGGKDSFVISVNFKDGDGDLGLRADQINNPYHALNFLANDNGELRPIEAELKADLAGFSYRKTKKTPKNPSYFILSPSGNVGELITLASRNQGFSLPPFEKPYNCSANNESYLNEQQSPDTIFIFRDDGHLIKNKATIVDILENNQNRNVFYYAVVDYFYMNVNPAHTNIKVKFLLKNGDGTFTEYDWRREVCETYDGRFPVPTDKTRPLDGTINYAMISSGFVTTFGNKRMKLAVTITDQALRTSNTVESKEFTLDEIRRNP